MSNSAEKEFLCPYCGQRNGVVVEGIEGKTYQFVTDCEVCCRPIVIHVKFFNDDCAIDAHAENE